MVKFQANKPSKRKGSCALVTRSVRYFVHNITLFNCAGIPYGPEVTEEEARSQTTVHNRGLLFVSGHLLGSFQSNNMCEPQACYQSNLADGFHFLQKSQSIISILYGEIISKSWISLGQQRRLPHRWDWTGSSCA
jgi:hypothetical protein